MHAKLYSKYIKLQIMFNKILVVTHPLLKVWAAQIRSFSADNYDIVVALTS